MLFKTSTNVSNFNSFHKKVQTWYPHAVKITLLSCKLNIILLGCRKSHDAFLKQMAIVHFWKLFATTLLLCHLRWKTNICIFAIFYCYFHKKKNGRQAYENLRKVYSDIALQERQSQQWLNKFCASDFNLNNAPRSRRPT